MDTSSGNTVESLKHKYGSFTVPQIHEVKMSLRKDIFFLLLCVDPKTKQEYKYIDVNKSFENLLYKIGGLNTLLFCQPEVVTVLTLLQEAYTEYLNPEFSFKVYRKLILDAGAAVLSIREVDKNA